jgi:hypothetical protein
VILRNGMMPELVILRVRDSSGVPQNSRKDRGRRSLHPLRLVCDPRDR